MITPFEMYWLVMLDSINTFLLCVGGGMFIAFGLYCAGAFICWLDPKENMHVAIPITSGTLAVVGLMMLSLSFFLPNTK